MIPVSSRRKTNESEARHVECEEVEHNEREKKENHTHDKKDKRVNQKKMIGQSERNSRNFGSNLASSNEHKLFSMLTSDEISSLLHQLVSYCVEIIRSRMREV